MNIINGRIFDSGKISKYDPRSDRFIVPEKEQGNGIRMLCGKAKKKPAVMAGFDLFPVFFFTGQIAQQGAVRKISACAF